MVAFVWNLALLALAAPALAMPAPNGTVELSKRAITSPSYNWADCQGYNFYQKSAVTAAAQEAVRLLQDGDTVGFNSYPHRYYNSENIPFQAGCNSPWYEFPILPNGKLFTGWSGPGTDRVVIGTWSGANAHLC
ncbi:unnamed protein product, partial [Rhizoctonia solani]